MLEITLADLRYRYRQFLIAIIGAGAVLAMAVILTGLANGFRTEINATVGGVHATRWVLSTKSDGRITSVSTFSETAVATLAKTPGVTRADGLVLLPQEVLHVGSRLVTVNVMGVTVGGLGQPKVHGGHTLSGAGQVVVDSRTEISRGSLVKIGNTPLRVVGTVNGRTLVAGIPMIYVTLGDAQAALLGGLPTVTAVVTAGVPQSVPTGLESLSVSQVNQDTLRTLASATSSIEKSRTLMWIIAAIIIAALIYVSALQRVGDFAVLKALGSSSASLFGSLCLQAVIITVLAAAVGEVLSKFLTPLFKQPISVPTSAYLSLPLIAIGVGVVASLVALRRATGADPVSAFGG